MIGTSKKKQVDRVYTPQHWMDVIRSAKKTKPFTVVSVSQDVFFDFQSHLASSFKKTVSNGGERLRIQDAIVFEHSQKHPLSSYQERNSLWAQNSKQLFFRLLGASWRTKEYAGSVGSDSGGALFLQWRNVPCCTR